MLKLSERSLALLVKLDSVMRFEEVGLVVELVECLLGGATTRRSFLCLKSNGLLPRFLLFYKRPN